MVMLLYLFLSIHLFIDLHSLSTLCAHSVCSWCALFSTHFVLSLQLLTSLSCLGLFPMTSHLCSYWLPGFQSTTFLAHWQVVNELLPTSYMVCSISLLWPWKNGCRSVMNYPSFTTPAFLRTWPFSGLEPSHKNYFPGFVWVLRALGHCSTLMLHEAKHLHTDSFTVVN